MAVKTIDVIKASLTFTTGQPQTNTDPNPAHTPPKPGKPLQPKNPADKRKEQLLKQKERLEKQIEQISKDAHMIMASLDYIANAIEPTSRPLAQALDCVCDKIAEDILADAERTAQIETVQQNKTLGDPELSREDQRLVMRSMGKTDLVTSINPVSEKSISAWKYRIELEDRAARDLHSKINGVIQVKGGLIGLIYEGGKWSVMSR